MKSMFFTIVSAVVIVISGFVVVRLADRYAAVQIGTESSVVADAAGNFLLSESNTPVLYDWKDYDAQTKYPFPDFFGKEALYGDSVDSMGTPYAFLNAVHLGLSTSADTVPEEDLLGILEVAESSEDGRTQYLKEYAYPSAGGETMMVSFVVQDSVVVYFDVQEQAQTAQENFSREQIQEWKTTYETDLAEFDEYAIKVREAGGIFNSEKTTENLYSTKNPLIRFWGTQAGMLDYGFVSALPLYAEPSEQDILFSGGKIYHTMLFLAKDLAGAQEKIDKSETYEEYDTNNQSQVLSYFLQDDVRITTVYNPNTNRIEGFRLQM